MDKKPYVVLMGETIGEIEEKVAHALDNGYILAGGIGFNPHEMVYIQAVHFIKIKQEEVAESESVAYIKGDMFA
ncbi:hypothetical protein GCM10027341_15170 [Spirosoma knui]